MMKDFYIHRSEYHDGSTKGFRHGIKHKRHHCFRGDVRVLQRIDGKMVQISRVRKRFKIYEDAHAWARGLKCKE